MSPITTLAVAFFIAGATPGQAQSEPKLTREGGFWIGVVSGDANSSTISGVDVHTAGGGVTVNGAAQGGSIHYEWRCRLRAGTEQEARSEIERVRVVAHEERGWLHLNADSHVRRASAELILNVPPRPLSTRIATAGGSIRVFDIAGSLDGHTGGGEIVLDRISGPATAKTGGGQIDIGRATGAVLAHTGGGSIHVKETGPDSAFETGGGEVVVEHAAGNIRLVSNGGNIRIRRADGSVTARTSGGTVVVGSATGFVVAETAGGAIDVGAAHGVQCVSAAGAIRLKNILGSVRATAAAGNILAELLAGARFADSQLSTHAGDITVVIPPALVLSIVANGGFAGRILSDFPEIRVRQTGSSGASPVIAEGSLNGGGPVLRLSANSGSIYLKRQTSTP